MLDVSAVYAINFYQRHLSPYKGFQCAYRVHTGRCSCSEYAKRIVRKRGVGALFVALPRQFARCRSAYTTLLATQATQTREQRRRSKKREDKTDCCPLDGCSACDVPFECPDLPCDIGPCDCSL
jgi:putative component of membrane protein insertase Oxa1/YidC/SpoIIIJ protein YidD